MKEYLVKQRKQMMQDTEKALNVLGVKYKITKPEIGEFSIYVKGTTITYWAWTGTLQHLGVTTRLAFIHGLMDHIKFTQEVL